MSASLHSAEEKSSGLSLSRLFFKDPIESVRREINRKASSSQPSCGQGSVRSQEPEFFIFPPPPHLLEQTSSAPPAPLEPLWFCVCNNTVHPLAWHIMEGNFFNGKPCWPCYFLPQ